MKKLLILVFLAAIVGFGNFLLNPNRPVLELATDEITIEMALEFPSDTIILDARSPKEFSESRIANAINLSEENFEEQVGVFLDVWNPDSKIIVYCSSSSCSSSRNIANRLRDEFQIKNVYVLKGDWREWKK
jgi:rhodanese-related sulfurtransferase